MKTMSMSIFTTYYACNLIAATLQAPMPPIKYLLFNWLFFRRRRGRRRRSCCCLMCACEMIECEWIRFNAKIERKQQQNPCYNR